MNIFRQKWFLSKNVHQNDFISISSFVSKNVHQIDIILMSKASII